MNLEHRDTTDALQVIDRFGRRSPSPPLRSLGNAGGMSGVALWRLEAGEDRLCLRRWPATHPDPERLSWIHRQLAVADAAGCSFIPVPIRSRDGCTWVRHSGHLWELSRWMPGAANYATEPTSAKLSAALKSLAQFHLATSPQATPPCASPGLADRWRQLRRLTVSAVRRHEAAVERAAGEVGLPLADLARDILRSLPACQSRALVAVERAGSLPVSLQPCLRDIWHDHVLFQDERVSGFVDFGAMRVESPMGDIARLLGSLVGNDGPRWQLGLEAYRALRPVAEEELKLLAAFDAANITLAGLNWIRWLFEERRFFEDMNRVAGRLSHIGQRAHGLAHHDWPFAQQD